MRKHLSAQVVTLLLASAPPIVAQAPNLSPDVWALTNARIETVTRGTIERGTIVIRKGLIESVGPSVTPPADARVVDFAGRTIYPGIIDLTSTIGLPSAPAGGGQGGQGQGASASTATWNGLDPDRLVGRELRPAAADVRAARDAGITAALVAPTRGAFRGQSALLPLRDDSAESYLLRSPVALHMGFQARTDNSGGGGGGGGNRYPGTLLGVIAYERQALYDAQRQALVLERYAANPRGMGRPESDPDIDALVPVVRGQLPVFFVASNENEIRRAARLTKEFNLKTTYVGATEGFRAIDALRGAPVAVSVDFPRTSDITGWSYRSSQRHAPDDSAAADAEVRKKVEGNAAALHAAGISFALTSGTLRPADFIVNVRKAVAAGLPRDVALRALTARAAELAGVGEQLGSIEVGKIANLVVTQGDLLSDSGRVRTVFVDGLRYDVTPPARPTAAGRGARGADAPAQLGGTWSLTINSPQGDVPSTLTITQNADAFSGTMTSQFGTAPVTDGLITGRGVTWSMTLNIQGNQVTIAYRGEVDDAGTRIKGNADLGQFGSATFTGEKRP